MGEADNLAALTAMLGQGVGRIRQRRPMKRLILDMDGSVGETYGQQEGSMYNGRFACECYHPLLVSDAKLTGRVFAVRVERLVRCIHLLTSAL